MLFPSFWCFLNGFSLPVLGNKPLSEGPSNHILCTLKASDRNLTQTVFVFPTVFILWELRLVFNGAFTPVLFVSSAVKEIKVQSHFLNFSRSTFLWLSLNLTHVLISNRLSMEIFLGRKAARMTPRVLSLRLISYSMTEQFQGNMIMWMWWWHLSLHPSGDPNYMKEWKQKEEAQTWASTTDV